MSINLSKMSAGFENVERDSQRIFRTVMDSFSRPGLRFDMSAIVQASPGEDASVAGTLLLALMESASTLYVSKSLLTTQWPSFLKFHTGCVLSQDCSQAQFIWIHQMQDLPSLKNCALGSPEFPDQSSTVIIDVEAIHLPSTPGDGKVWSGPGIKEPITVDIMGLPKAFWLERQSLQNLYPCGVDIIFCTPSQIVSLPRSTHIGESACM